MKKDVDYHFRTGLEKKETINDLIDEYCELAGISPYNHKSDILADTIIAGVKKMISSFVPDTQTNLQKCSLQQEKISIIQKIMQDLITLPKPFDDVFKQIFEDKITFGLDIRTRAKWFNLLFETPEIRILDLRKYDNTIGDVIVVHESNKYYNQLFKNCHYFPIGLVKARSLTTASAARKFMYSVFNNKFRNSITPDKAEKFAIKSLKFEMGYLGEKPMLLDPCVKEILELRAAGEFKAAAELLQQEAAHQLKLIKEAKAAKIDDELKVLDKWRSDE